MLTVSEIIRSALKNSEISRYQIAQETRVQEATLSRFVNGERGLSMSAIDRLADYFGYRLVKSKGR